MKVGWPHHMDKLQRFTQSPTLSRLTLNVLNFFAANKVPEDLQVPVLLSSIGTPTYSLLSDLFAPAVPGSKLLQDISAPLHRHFKPKQVVIA